MATLTLDHPVVGAVLSTARALLGHEAVYLGLVDGPSYRFARVHGALPGVDEGAACGFDDTFCKAMLAGGPTTTSDAENDATYAGCAMRAALGVVSYAGVPVYDDGEPLLTLCGVDREHRVVPEPALEVLRGLGGVLAAHLRPPPEWGVTIVRTESGWSVDGTPVREFAAAMVLADLLATEDLPTAGRPARAEATQDEVSRLRLAVSQLEHALTHRVVIEQAIGVLAERGQTTPREAFERVRKIARSRGQRVHELSRAVVASTHSAEPGLPSDLVRP